MPDKFQTPKFPTIPIPDTTLDSVYKTCVALKQSVEMLTGIDSQPRSGVAVDRFAAHVFVQSATPVALHKGDMWVSLGGQNTTFNVWDGVHWLLVATVQPLP